MKDSTARTAQIDINKKLMIDAIRANIVMDELTWIAYKTGWKFLGKPHMVEKVKKYVD